MTDWNDDAEREIRALFKNLDWDGARRLVMSQLTQDLTLRERAVWLVTRGATSYQVGDFAGCLADYDAALDCDPDCVAAWHNKAYLLACCPDEARLDGEAALACALKAGALTDFVVWECLAVIGAALCRLQRFPEARGALARALDVAPRGAHDHIRQLQSIVDERRPITGTLDADAKRLRWGFASREGQ